LFRSRIQFARAQVIAGEYAKHSGGRLGTRNVDRPKFTVGMIGAKKSGMGVARNVYVVGESAASCNKTNILPPPHRLRNAELLHLFHSSKDGSLMQALLAERGYFRRISCPLA
jgi:hypothetical protein